MDNSFGKKFLYGSVLSLMITSSHAGIFCKNCGGGDTFQGIYGGFSIGYKSLDYSNTTVVLPIANTYFNLPTNVSQINALGSNLDTKKDTAELGFQFGVNQMYDDWFYGGEIDLSIFNGKAGYFVTTPYFQSTPPSNITLTVENDSKVMLSLRPRIGYVINQRALLYATAGVALSQIKATNQFSDDYATGGIASGATETASKSSIQFSGIVGGGFEYNVYDNLNLRVEYLYVKFKNSDSSGMLQLNNLYVQTFPAAAGLNQFAHLTDLSTYSVRFGLVYEFGNKWLAF